MSASTLRAALVLTLLLPIVDGAALAQTPQDRGGFAVRELSVSTGYTFVELPPITLGGYLPSQIFQEDLITSGTAAIDWSHVTPRTQYSLGAFGTYTARTKYPELNSPGANLTFGATRALGRRWQIGAGVASGVTSSDQLASQPVSARRRIDDAASFEDLAGTVAVVRSPSPNLADAALFVPISQSFDASDVNGTRSLVGSGKVGVTYAHSVRFATNVYGAYTTVRDISSRDASRSALVGNESNAQSAGIGVKYDRSERTQITTDLTWSQTAGITADKVVSATVGYGWSGRKWFARTTVGAGMRPFRIEDGTASETDSTGRPTFIYSGAIGYKFRTQTVLVEYSRAPHDEYGHGGRNTTTGFEGNVQSVVGSWSWVPSRSRWTAHADFSLTRRPGNFSYIYTWLGTGGLGRQITSNVRVMGELLFDRHGSRSFEGFHLTRTGARINLVWTMPRRSVEPETSGQ